jgi:hypothetical protein
MNIPRLIFGLLSVAAMSAATPVAARSFSAQDVLTYCLATHADPLFVKDKLLSFGWIEVGPERADYIEQTIALAWTATRQPVSRTSYNPTDWSESWNSATKLAKSLLARPNESNSAILNSAILLDPESSSVIWITWSDGTAININCLLAVTEVATKTQTYHPRLPQPNGSDAFYTVLEGNHLSASRALNSAMLVSVEPRVVEAAIPIETDIVAVFKTYNTYPSSAVRLSPLSQP